MEFEEWRKRHEEHIRWRYHGYGWDEDSSHRSRVTARRGYSKPPVHVTLLALDVLRTDNGCGEEANVSSERHWVYLLVVIKSCAKRD